MSEIARLNQSSRQGMIPTLFQNRDVLRAGLLKDETYWMELSIFLLQVG